MELLTELVDEQGLTVVLVTHERDVAAYARRTIRMRDGRIIDDSGTDRQMADRVPAGTAGP